MAGALASALLASLCCVGPVVAVSMGLGGAVSLFSALEPLRPLFVLLAVGLLVHAFVRAYRRAPTGAEVTGTGPAHRRRSLLWGGAVACTAVLALGLPWASSALAQAVSPDGGAATDKPTAAGEAQVVLAVEGADCASCLLGVRRALEKMPGVTALEAGPAPHQLRVRYAASQLTPTAILQAAQAKSDRPVRIEG
jgi:mercuric ion transport protein